MEFSPFNRVVRLCLQGMEKEEQHKREEAAEIFLQSWQVATNDFEKFLSAHYIARHQNSVSDRLKWLETTLEFAMRIDDHTVKSAFPALYSKLARCYEELNDQNKAKEYDDLATGFQFNPSDKGPFYHGTRASLQIGDLLVAGGNSNYQADLRMNHIYFTANVNGAGLAAALAKGEGAEKVYIIEPTGEYENDPNLTDKKFPGNPTRSYRSVSPLRIIGEVTEWVRAAPEEIQRFREKLENNKGEIIN